MLLLLVLYSPLVIRLPLINGINVEKYLNYVFENINKESIDNNYHIQLI